MTAERMHQSWSSFLPIEGDTIENEKGAYIKKGCHGRTPYHYNRGRGHFISTKYRVLLNRVLLKPRRSSGGERTVSISPH